VPAFVVVRVMRGTLITSNVAYLPLAKIKDLDPLTCPDRPDKAQKQGPR